MPRRKYTPTYRSAIHVIGPSIAYVPLTKGRFSLVDREDADALCQWKWHITTDPSRGDERAVRHYILDGKVRVMFIHQAIIGVLPEGFTIDHVLPGNTLDNRRGNLRPASQSEQQANRRVFRVNFSGLKGAFRARGRWKSKISVNGKHYHLGTFPTAELAHEAYAVAAHKYRGEFARTQ